MVYINTYVTTYTCMVRAYNIYGAWYVPALPCSGLADVHVHCVGLVCLLPRTDLVLN